jgi:hypothetical protein
VTGEDEYSRYNYRRYSYLPSSSLHAILCLRRLYPLYHVSIFFAHYAMTPSFVPTTFCHIHLHPPCHASVFLKTVRNHSSIYFVNFIRLQSFLPTTVYDVTIFFHYIMSPSSLSPTVFNSFIFVTNCIIPLSSPPTISCLHLLCPFYRVSVCLPIISYFYLLYPLFHAFIFFTNYMVPIPF